MRQRSSLPRFRQARRAAFARPRSPETPAWAKNLQARDRARRGHRRRGRSLDKASPARARRAARSSAPSAPCAMAMAVRKASSAGAEFAGSRLSNISPRMRCRKASVQCSPVSSASANASSIRVKAPSASSPSASNSASSTLEEGSKQLVSLGKVCCQRLAQLRHASYTIAKPRIAPNRGIASPSPDRVPSDALG